jgi:hypothetical protein
MRTILLLTQAAILLASVGAEAQGYKPVTVLHSLPGWQCMALASAYGPNGINAPPAPVFASADSSAQVGSGAGVIIVPSPLTPTSGRTEMIWPNGKKVWIDVSQLTQWRSLSNPRATCQPALMSNGRYGFTTAN